MNLNPCVDLFIIGGGINGCGIARDASGRGLSVILAEQDDLAQATSSASTKLIHGGLRYLEQFQFRLVREALKEREVLCRQAPHLITPLRFVLPHQAHLRPKWMIKLGLFLYDHLAVREFLPDSEQIALADLPAGNPLNPKLSTAFSYYDCWVDDARLVVANAIAARENGAEILTRCRCIKAQVQDDHWLITLLDTQTQQTWQVQAKMLVNAAGPWVNQLFEQALPLESPQGIRLVKGSHVIVPKLYQGEQAFILQQPDKRIIFTIPYEENFTLIGTTDEVVDSPDSPELSVAETDYLCQSVNSYFQKQISRADIIWSYAGVRPLLDDGRSQASQVSRDYELVCCQHQGLPLLSVFGGKITTFRKLAEQAMRQIARYFPEQSSAWTENVPLPGGELPEWDQSKLVQQLSQTYPWAALPMLQRYVSAYGTRATLILANSRSTRDLGHFFGSTLFSAEIDYLRQYEWAQTAEDVLWRRSKLGLHLSMPEYEAVARYMSIPTTAI